MTSSAFSFNMAVMRSGFILTKGIAASFERAHDRESQQYFCEDCGTWLFTESIGAPHATIVRVSSLDEHRDLAPVGQIWSKSALPWALIDGISTAEEDPTSDMMMESMRRWSEVHPNPDCVQM